MERGLALSDTVHRAIVIHYNFVETMSAGTRSGSLLPTGTMELADGVQTQSRQKSVGAASGGRSALRTELVRIESHPRVAIFSVH